jgi:acyl-CoA synthetase (AMP-forming)/AMP-acid ligase II
MFKYKNRMMDNVQKLYNCINIPPAQTFRSYLTHWLTEEYIQIIDTQLYTFHHVHIVLICCICHLALSSCPKRDIFIAAGEMQDVVLGVLPFFHVYGLSSILVSSMYFGAKIVTLPQFKPDVYLSTLVKHKVGIIFTLPHM